MTNSGIPSIGNGSSASAPAGPLFKWWQEFIVEIMLIAITLTAVANLGRLFSESLWRVHVLAIAVLCHALWIITRRLRFPLSLAVIVNFVVVAFVFVFLRYSAMRQE